MCMRQTAGRIIFVDETGNLVQVGEPFFREERVEDSECCNTGFTAACPAAPVCTNEQESTGRLTFENGVCLEWKTNTEICRVDSVEVSRGTPVQFSDEVDKSLCCTIG